MQCRPVKELEVPGSSTLDYISTVPALKIWTTRYPTSTITQSLVAFQSPLGPNMPQDSALPEEANAGRVLESDSTREPTYIVLISFQCRFPLVSASIYVQLTRVRFPEDAGNRHACTHATHMLQHLC